jgi:hypothetical protein
VRMQDPDPVEGRRALAYALAVAATAVAVAALAAVLGYDSEECADARYLVCGTPEKHVLAFGPTLILLFGGLGAFGRTYSLWKEERYSRAWQGAGWALLVFMLIVGGLASPLLLDSP